MGGIVSLLRRASRGCPCPEQGAVGCCAAAQQARTGQRSKFVALATRQGALPPAKGESCVPFNRHHEDAGHPIRRTAISATSATLVVFLFAFARHAKAEEVATPVRSPAFVEVENAARDAYNTRNFEVALEKLSVIIRDYEPGDFQWYERRGQVYVDMKQFGKAIEDFETAEKMAGPKYHSLGLLSNKGLAHEGLAQWDLAVACYSEAIDFGKQIGFDMPFVLNSRGNAYSSLGRWEEALHDYQASSDVFQRNRNLSAAIYSASNAALVLAQLGNSRAALEAVRKVASRAPGSVDMRAAQAALLWDEGQAAKAEDVWSFACSRIETGVLREGDLPVDGCAQYRDLRWLEVERRWPPVMLAKWKRFITLQRPESVS